MRLNVSDNGFSQMFLKLSDVDKLFALQIIMKSLDPLRAKKIFIRKKLGHTAVSAIKASSVAL